MVYVDKRGRLRNSKKDMEKFVAYCRERVQTFRNSDAFLKRINLEWDNWYLRNQLMKLKSSARHARK